MRLKPSAYNIIVPPDRCEGDEPPRSEHGIVYNARTGRLAIAGRASLALLETGTSFDAPIGDAPIQDMVRAGFMVDEGRNEFVEIEAEYALQQRDASVLSLCIAPTYACNLACPYCYEEGRSSPGKKMDQAMQDKVVGFAKAAYDAEPYERIEIQWYGGEPMLVPDAIERISEALMRFCEERGLGFSAILISNATRIGPEEAAMLKRCCVEGALVTVDGPERIHNQRRPARDGSNSYEAVLDGIGNLVRECIGVKVVMNTDRANDPLFDELNGQLNERFGLSAVRMKLNDYYGTYGQGRFCEPGFSLMDHREFTQLQCDRFCREGHSPNEFAELLKPIPLFCRGQMERYYCIDAMGDVYKCDGHMGRPDHAAFNICDISCPSDIPTGLAPDYPFDEASCTACDLLPLCKGTCEWERKQCADHPCHPLKYTAKEYLRGWVSSLGIYPNDDAELQLLN